MTGFKALRAVLLGIAALGLAACASKPVTVPEGTVINEASPADVDPDSEATVLWGGLIVNTTVIESGTRMEILAYRLDRIGQPSPYRDSIGRFVAMHSDFLEPLDYAPGREITVIGTLDGAIDASIGETTQRLPVVSVSDHHLWRIGGRHARPRVTFGFGVHIRN